MFEEMNDGWDSGKCNVNTMNNTRVSNEFSAMISIIVMMRFASNPDEDEEAEEVEEETARRTRTRGEEEEEVTSI
jgi:hypothetical protein